MENKIILREALTDTDRVIFWQQLRLYFARDLFPEEPEDLEYFLGEEYASAIETIHSRPHDRLRYFFFCREGQDIGLAMPVIYDTEDGKCMIMEFCVFPEYRGGGTGSACARLLLERTRADGAAYWEINCEGEKRTRFWKRLGFRENGADEWGVPLMILQNDK